MQKRQQSKTLLKLEKKLRDRLKNDFEVSIYNENEILLKNQFISISYKKENDEFMIMEKDKVVLRKNKEGLINNFNDCIYGWGMYCVANYEKIKEVINEYFYK